MIDFYPSTQIENKQRIKVTRSWQQNTIQSHSAKAIMNHIAYGKASAQAPPVQLGFVDFFSRIFLAQLSLANHEIHDEIFTTQ